MKIEKSNITLVIPAYNEERRIRKVLERFGPEGYEIVVVNNGSTDGTSLIVGEYTKKNININLLEFREKLGKGGAIIEGFKKANGDLVGFIDSDDSMDAEGFQKIVSMVTEVNVDGAIASRWSPGSVITRKQPFGRRLASRVFNLIVRIMFDLPYSDTQCGAKVFKKDALVRTLPNLRSKGFEFDVELLWRLKKSGYNIQEVPVTWRHEKGSTFSLTHAPMMLWNLIKIRWRN